jgi:PmbA protein
MKAERLLGEIGRRDSRRPVITAWSLYVTESRRLSLGVKDREAGNAHAPLTIAESTGLRYLLVWEDALVSRGYLEKSQFDGDPCAALLQARAAAYEDPDAAQVAGPAEVPDVGTHDDGAAAVAAGDTALFAERLAEARRLLAAEPVRTWSGSFSASEATSQLVTSAGFEARGRGTSIGWHLSLDGQIGDGYSSRAPETGDEFHERLSRLLSVAGELRRDGGGMDGGTHPILLHPRVVEEYVVDTLLSNLQGSTVAHRSGAFSPAQFGDGTPVFREDLGLRVDPLVPMRRGSYRFSSEGVPAAPTAFVEHGRLVSPILDLKYARRLGLPPTAVPVATDTLHLEGPPPIALDRALDLAGGGALVLSVLGVHTQDSTSGDFSLSAPQVLSVAAGGFAGKLKATISGNLFELLRRDDLQWVTFPGENTPGILYRGRIDPS